MNRALRQGLSKSTSYENKQMLNDTADILASMVKARRRMHESNSSSRQVKKYLIGKSISREKQRIISPRIHLHMFPEIQILHRVKLSK